MSVNYSFNVIKIASCCENVTGVIKYIILVCESTGPRVNVCLCVCVSVISNQSTRHKPHCVSDLGKILAPFSIKHTSRSVWH